MEIVHTNLIVKGFKVVEVGNVTYGVNGIIELSLEQCKQHLHTHFDYLEIFFH